MGYLARINLEDLCRMRVLITVLFFGIPSWILAQANMDSLRQVLDKTTTPEARVNVLLPLSTALRASDIQQSTAYLEEATRLVEEHDLRDQAGAVYNMLGVNYAMQDNYLLAQKNLLVALEHYKVRGDKAAQADVFNNLAGTLMFHGSLEEADRALDQAIVLWLDLKDSSRVALGFLSRGLLQIEKQNPAGALRYLESAGRIFKQQHLKDNEALLLLGTGKALHRLRRYEEAKQTYRQALLADQDNNLTELWLRMGELFLNEKQYDSAQRYLNHAIVLADQGQQKQEKVEAYELLSQIARDRGDFKTALQYLERHDSLEHALFDTEKSRQIQQLQAEFENEQKDEQLMRNAAQISRQRMIIGAVTVVVMALLLFIALGMRFYRNKLLMTRALQQFNQAINEKNEEIMAQAIELQEANVAIQAMNENLERMVHERTDKIQHQKQVLIEYTFMNAHKLRGPLARILGLINLYKLNPAEAADLFDKIDLSARELDDVVKEINTLLEKRDMQDLD